MHSQYNRAEDRYGSASLANEADCRRAGLIGGNKGAYIGHMGRHALRLPNDGSVALFGGAGSGKSSSIYALNELTDYIGCNSITLDLRGELTAIGTLSATMQGYHQYTFNPYGVPWCPQHGTNPLDHLNINNPTLISDTRKVMIELLELPEERKWWLDDALQWSIGLLLVLCERDGVASLPTLYTAILNMNGANFDEWLALYERMGQSRFAEVQQVAEAIAQAQNEGRDGFRAPMNALISALSFMQEPAVFNALQGQDFSLDVICRTDIKAKVKIVIPMQYLGQSKGLIRLLLSRPIQDKMRIGGSHKIAVLIDECGQINRSESVRELFTFARGAGAFGLCAWQEVSQIYGAFGNHGGNEIIGSALVRSFAGVKTMETARLASSLAGVTTNRYDDIERQSDFTRQKQLAVQSIMNGGNIAEAVANIRHYKASETRQSKEPRELYKPDEVLNLDGALTFVSGLVQGPIHAHWPRYFECKSLAGKYLANPFHDENNVLIKGKKVPVITEDCPSTLQHLPQYQSGTWQYVKGYRPRIQG